MHQKQDHTQKANGINVMKKLNIQQKLFLIPAIVVAVIIFVFGWVSSSNQTAQAEKAFHDQLFMLAHNSKVMIHSAADVEATDRGWKFHRILTDGSNAKLSAEEGEALTLFTQNDTLQFVETKMVEGDSTRLAIFVPARIQEECFSCHNESGVDIFQTKNVGDLVAVFGVSGSLEELIRQEAMIRWVTVGIGFLSVLVIVGVIRFLVKKIIVAPLSEMVSQSEHVANGDLRSYETKELAKKITSADEIGQLTRGYKAMLDSLRNLIQQVGDSASAVSSASTEISSTTEQMAAGAQQQSSQTSEVAAAVEQMTKTLMETSANIRKVADGANQARHDAEQGGKVVEETIGGMHRISDVVTQSAERVKVLGASSDKIGEIIEVIDDIADQTNLLALNAAIEAARAGDQGRGFAVVADEVRKLAERTSKATKEISMMIHKIQSDTHHAVDSMNKGTEEVSAGIALAERAGSMLSNIVGNAQSVSDMVAQIASASEEQSNTSEQISQNVVSISTVTQESASGTQQIARTSEDLNRLTEHLMQIIDRFQLDDRNGSSRIDEHQGMKEGSSLRKSKKAITENGTLVEQY